MLGSHVGSDSSPIGPLSHPAPCFWPGKTAENSQRLLDPAPMWETQMRLQGPENRSAKLQLLCLLEEWIIEQIFLSVSALCIFAFKIQIGKYEEIILNQANKSDQIMY